MNAASDADVLQLLVKSRLVDARWDDLYGGVIAPQKVHSAIRWSVLAEVSDSASSAAVGKISARRPNSG